MSRTAWIWIIIIVLIGLIVWGVLSRQTPNAEVPDVITPSIENRVTMSDQAAGSLNISVTSAYLQEPGFIVIHENVSGGAGRIVASSTYLPAGQSRNVMILTGALLDGKTYFAMLHKDNGDQKFDASQDAPMTDEDANVVMTEFKISGNVLGEQKS